MGVAYDGIEAKQMVIDHRPDIVIMDINMPLMDGLTFCEYFYMNRRDLHLNVILLTGYNNFQYARKAIEYGVISYLLKPIDVDELRDVLNKVKAKIEKTRLMKLNLDQMKEKVRYSDRILREDFLSKVIRNGHVEEEEKKQLSEKLNVNKGKMSCLLIHTTLFNKLSQCDKELTIFSIINVASETLGNCQSKLYEIFCDKDTHIIIIINTGGFYDDKLRLLAEKIVFNIKTYINCSVHIGVGKQFCHFEGIAKSYQTAITALNNRIIYPQLKVLEYDKLIQTTKNSMFFKKEMADIMIEMRIGNVEAIHNVLKNIFIALQEKGSYSHLRILMSRLLTLIKEYGHDIHENLLEDSDIHHDVQVIMKENEALEDIHRWFNNKFQDIVILATQKAKTNECNEIVVKAKQFIDHHYKREDISLKMIAKHIFINPSYLSNIFKKETGVSVIDYVTMRRMDEAKRMFDKECQIVKRIAESVGYHDYRYFSKCFKKYTGITPQKYIQMRKDSNT